MGRGCLVGKLQDGYKQALPSGIHVLILNLCIWVGASDFLLTHRIWQNWWKAFQRLSCKETVASIFLSFCSHACSLRWKSAATLWADIRRSPHNNELRESYRQWLVRNWVPLSNSPEKLHIANNHMSELESRYSLNQIFRWYFIPGQNLDWNLVRSLEVAEYT